MNRNSLVPLWAVLSVGVVLVGGIYIYGRQTATRPVAGIIATQPSPMRPQVSGNISNAAPVDGQNTATSAAVDMTDWQTYRNTKYGFTLMYPPEWAVSAPSEGAARPAEPTDSDISVAPTIGELGLSVSVRELGPDLVAGYWSHPLKTLDEYLRIETSNVSTSSLAFSRQEIVDGHRAMRYITCWGAGEFHQCGPRIYIQDGKNIYIIDDTDPESALPSPSFDAIMSLFHFGL
ncbi:MAG: hypothetical protein WAQ52_14410 [Terriglobales bacterium]